MPHRKVLLVAVLAPCALIVACNNDDINSIAPLQNAAVRILDQCDPASFNAALGAGACTGSGTTTFAAFNNELNATGRVAAWAFDPPSLALRSGQAIVATNYGGEEHTFTEVANFGGGIVPALNTASGNPLVAPECNLHTAADHLKPGASVTTDAETAVGVHRYQCCIPPWMREVVTVSGS
jgi:plastocyanin